MKKLLPLLLLCLCACGKEKYKAKDQNGVSCVVYTWPGENDNYAVGDSVYITSNIDNQNIFCADTTFRYFRKMVITEKY